MMHTLRHLRTQRTVGVVSNQCIRLLASSTAPMDGERTQTEKCINRVTLLGRVGRAGEIRGSTENPCVIFPLATNLTFTKGSTGEFMKRTDWHRICVFRPGLREYAHHLDKGDRVLVGGSLSQHRYMDDDNKLNIVTSILADELIVVDRRNKSVGEDPSADKEDDL